MASRLAEMQARFQQKQMQDREEKLLRLYENQQQRAFDRVGRGSAGSNTSIGSTGGGQVRQMFEERRQKAGVDKSYPLQPINGKINGKTPVSTKPRLPNTRQPIITNSKKTVQSTVQRSVTHIRNGKPLIDKRETVQKIYNNNNGVENFEQNHYNENFLDTQDNLVDLMNRHNVYDNLDDEESPPLENGVDDLSFTEKLSNVGGIRGSQLSAKTVVERPKQIVQETKQSSTVKPLTRKSPLKPHVVPQKSNSPMQTATRSASSNNSSPQHTTQKMATTAKSNPASTRTPSNTRPSSKQTAPRAAMSAVVRDDLQECSYCGRRFAADRVHKHEDICGKTNKKQRKTYDAFKHRVAGTEIEQFVGGPKKKGSKFGAKKPGQTVPMSQSKKNWRRTHEEFIATIRSAKMAQAHLANGGKLSDLPPPPPSTNPDYVQCPSCGRRFNEAAAQRHIPKCASYDFNKPKPGATKKR